MTIKKKVDPKWEARAIADKFGEEGKFPVMLSENINNLEGKKSGFQLVTGVFGSCRRCAKLIDSTIRQLAIDYAERMKKLVYRDSLYSNASFR